MSAIAKNVNGSCEPLPNENRIKTKFWGLTCETGLKYNQRVKKKYCVTQAVLDPDSYKKDDSSKFVSVIVEHDEEEHIMAVLKHGEIYQVNLNMLFDRENVTFYLKGNGTVNLLGYEVIDPEESIPEDFTRSPKDVKASKMKVENVSDAETSKSKTSKGGKKTKKQEEEDESDDEGYMKFFATEFKDISDEEDEDFSLGNAQSDNAESDEDDDSEEDEEQDSDEESYESLDMENILEYGDIDQPGPSSSRKRSKRPNAEFNQKRSKLEAFSPKASSSKTDDSIAQENDSEESDEELARPKKKQKYYDAENEEVKVTKKLEGGVEVTDLRMGHGPKAVDGKLVHVFYLGRLADKTVFDSVLPGKKPFAFRLGANKVIKGWEIGLQGMRVGGKRKIKVPPSMGYGNKSIDEIPPNSTLYFTIDLQRIT